MRKKPEAKVKNENAKNIDSKSQKKDKTKEKQKIFQSAEKALKFDDLDDSILNKSMNIPLKNKMSFSAKKQLDIASYFSSQKSKLFSSPSKVAKINQNKYTSHLIALSKENNIIVYSYKIKRHNGIINNNTILFECNHKNCKGRAEYDINKKIFKETVKHNIIPASHNISSLYACYRDKLLKDKETNGYQLLKGSSSDFIKDKKILFLK